MMIIVLCHKIQMIDQSHGLFEPRMRDRPGKQRTLKSSNSIHQLQSHFPELGKNFLDAAPVMSRFVSLSIAQVGGREFDGPCQVVVNPRHPQGLEIKQVPGVLLRRPLPFRLSH